MPHPANRPKSRQLDLSTQRDVAVAGHEQLMEAMVAACAIVAAADGQIDGAERQRIFRLMRSISLFDGFSRESVAAEFERHERQLNYEPFSARDKVLDAIETLEASPSEARLLLSACQAVLEADGISHPAEYQALKEIGKALAVA